MKTIPPMVYHLLMDDLSEIRAHLHALVNSVYVINIEEISESLGVEIKNDRLNLEVLADAPKSSLKAAMMTAISWSEFLSSRKAVINAKLQMFKFKVEQRISKEKLDYMNGKSNARGSKAESELYVGSLPDIQSDRVKLSNYESYITYLDSLSKQLDMIHYAAKELLKDQERFERVST